MPKSHNLRLAVTTVDEELLLHMAPIPYLRFAEEHSAKERGIKYFLLCTGPCTAAAEETLVTVSLHKTRLRNDS
jgi:hypothetical protein